MATLEDIVTTLQTRLNTTLADGVISFRQNDSSANFMDGGDYAAILKALADEDVQDVLNGTANQSRSIAKSFMNY